VEGISCSSSLDSDLGVIWCLLDQFDVLAAQVADTHDAVPISGVAVVENEVVEGA
jgi:hypothetical protein